MPSRAVLVLGVPSSGNRFWQEQARHCGAEFAGVYHFGGRGADKRLARWAEEAWDVRAIVPIRQRKYVFASWKTAQPRLLENYGFDTKDQAYNEHYGWTASWLADHAGIESLNVRYEEMIREGEVYVRAVMNWLGLEWKGLHQPIVDGNAKHLNSVGA